MPKIKTVKRGTLKKSGGKTYAGRNKNGENTNTETREKRKKQGERTAKEREKAREREHNGGFETRSRVWQGRVAAEVDEQDNC